MFPLVTGAAVATINRVIAEATAQRPARQMSIIAPDLLAETAAALSLLSVLQRVCDATGAALPGELQAGVNGAALLAAADFGGGSMRLPGKAVAVVEGCFELATRAVFRDVNSLGVIFGGARDAEDR